MTVIAVLDLRLVPDTLDDARAVLHRVLDETRAFDGCEGVDVVIDGTEPTHVVAIERWTDAEADAAYRTFRAGPGRIEDLGQFLSGPPMLTKGDLDPAL